MNVSGIYFVKYRLTLMGHYSRGVIMAKVKVKYFGMLREMLGVREEEYNVEDATLADLLLKYIPENHKDVAEKWVETIFVTVKGEVAVNRDGMPIIKNHFILVGGRNMNINYRLKDGDEVAILPPVGGGE
jgi:MoaD family protein